MQDEPCRNSRSWLLSRYGEKRGRSLVFNAASAASPKADPLRDAFHSMGNLGNERPCYLGTLVHALAPCSHLRSDCHSLHGCSHCQDALLVTSFASQMCAHVDLGHCNGGVAESFAQELDMVELVFGDLGSDPLCLPATGCTLILGDHEQPCSKSAQGSRSGMHVFAADKQPVASRRGINSHLTSSHATRG